MHRELRKLLENATGISQYVIAIVLDIRGFTPFCQTVDSVEVATYITKVYMKIIDGHFSNASFYKPTGDGLLVIIPYDKGSLKEAANSTMESCLKLLENFGNICEGDHMVNFDTPEKVGIGLTRGSACCITSEDKILDYSGKVLNLASRLMDIARPSGIVFDSNFGLNLLSDETSEFFSKEDSVYVRGIAEENPISVYYTKKHTIIPDMYKHPIKEPRWQTESITQTLQKLRLFSDKYMNYPLDRKPFDEKQIVVEVGWLARATGLRVVKYFDLTDKMVDYKIRGKEYQVRFDAKPLIKFLKSNGVTDDTEVKFDFLYTVR